MRQAKVAPEEDDVSSEEYDDSDNESSDEKDDNGPMDLGSAGPSRQLGPEIEADGVGWTFVGWTFVG